MSFYETWFINKIGRIAINSHLQRNEINKTGFLESRVVVQINNEQKLKLCLLGGFLSHDVIMTYGGYVRCKYLASLISQQAMPFYMYLQGYATQNDVHNWSHRQQ